MLRGLCCMCVYNVADEFFETAEILNSNLNSNRLNGIASQMKWDISRNAFNIDVNTRTIEFPQYMLFFLRLIITVQRFTMLTSNQHHQFLDNVFMNSLKYCFSNTKTKVHLTLSLEDYRFFTLKAIALQSCVGLSISTQMITLTRIA